MLTIIWNKIINQLKNMNKREERKMVRKKIALDEIKLINHQIEKLNDRKRHIREQAGMFVKRKVSL